MQLSETSFGQAQFINGILFKWHEILVVGRRRRVVLVLRTSVSLTRWCWSSSPGT